MRICPPPKRIGCDSANARAPEHLGPVGIGGKGGVLDGIVFAASLRIVSWTGYEC